MKLKPIIRKADQKDLTQLKMNQEKAKRAFAICNKKIQVHDLKKMKLVDVEYTLDAKKILFYFSADGKIDFRDLVKDLAAIFRTRIELRQIGVRDQSKILGGLGICGRPFCCNTFLDDFRPVSIKMAKEQGLSLNPLKISGTCGRLMCCLQHEQEAYEDLIKNTPKVGAYVSTPEGNGTVIEVNMITGGLRVLLDDKREILPHNYNKKDVVVIKDGHRED
jgi:cell fate regulator YaaT (PSP1 superfamily)